MARLYKNNLRDIARYVSTIVYFFTNLLTSVVLCVVIRMT